MFRFLTSTFTLEMMLMGLAMTALGGAGAALPVIMHSHRRSTDDETVQDARRRALRDAMN